MLVNQIGATIRLARKALSLSQKELAQRAQVATRLVGELERGERPNVSLETAFRILGEVGVSVRLFAPDGHVVVVAHPDAEDAARAARARVRRASWGGRQLRLRDEGGDDPASSSGASRLGAVTRISAQAHAIATSRGSR